MVRSAHPSPVVRLRLGPVSARGSSESVNKSTIPPTRPTPAIAPPATNASLLPSARPSAAQRMMGDLPGLADAEQRGWELLDQPDAPAVSSKARWEKAVEECPAMGDPDTGSECPPTVALLPRR
jgi:hypothetical protein